MSTNIQVDVILQRLKQVSDQTAQQNRSDKQEREEALLFEQRQGDTAQQGDTAFDANTRQPLSALEQLRAQDAAERSSVPDLYKKKRPAAQRLSVGGVFGVTYSFDGDPNDQRASKLRVGTTDFAKTAEVSGVFDPGRVLINDVTLPASGNNGTVVEAVGGLQYFDSNGSLNPYQAWSGLTSTGGGSPPLLYQGKVPPPASSTVDVWTASFDTFSGDGSAALVLPAGGQKCVFIYVHNKIKLFNTFRRIRRRLQERENPRPVPDADLAPGITNGVYYDLRKSDLTVFEYVNTQKFEAYEIFAFLVSPKKVRRITLPAKTRNFVQALFPPITQNSTANKVVQSGGGQVAGYGPGSPTFNFTIPGTSAPFPSVSQTVWRQGTTYGDYPANNDVLAKQYGIGFIQSVDHRGPFFSPAVYSYIKGDLNLKASDAKQYGAMRTQLKGVPPQKYLAPCVQSCNTDDTEFYSTTATPFSINNSINPNLFKLERSYTVKKGEVSGGFLYYCWDWDKPTYCTQQLSALGFTATDLQP